MFGIHWILWRRPSPSPSLSLGTPRNGGDTSVTVVTSNYQFHTRLFETNRFRKFVSDLWIDRGLKPILGSGTTQNWRRTPRRLDLQIGIFGYLVICTTDGACIQTGSNQQPCEQHAAAGRHVAANPSPLALPSVCKTTFNIVAQATAKGHSHPSPRTLAGLACSCRLLRATTCG